MGSGSSKPKGSPIQEAKQESNTSSNNHSESHTKATSAPSTSQQPENPINQESSSNTQNEQSEQPVVASQVATVDEENGIVAESEVSYAEFPTHVTLRLANEKFAKKRKGFPKNKDGTLQPFPSYRKKRDVFKKETCVKLDKYADEASADLLRKPIADIVNYLNKSCKTELEKARAYFRWLTTRDLNKLPQTQPGDAENAVLKTLVEIKAKESFNEYTTLYIDMCRAGGLEAQEVKGKVRTKCELHMVSEVDEFVNTWVAVVISNEWRLVDVQFAAVSVSGGSAGEWQLIGDTGKSKKGQKAEQSTSHSTVFKSDDFYFLTDPEEFIYNHRPFDDAWQLLSRPVTFSEYQKMAFLRSSFFERSLTIGDQSSYILEADDGEKEIRLSIAAGDKYRFSYKLWRSTKDIKNEQHGGFELSQFVLLHQKDGSLRCKVIFPVAGDYKLDIFGRTETEASPSYSLVCTYIIKVDQARDEWTAFPKNPRNEWGRSHEMDDLGLLPITHKDAIIETDDGKLYIRFQCTKDPVDCQVTLRRNQDSKDTDLTRCLLFRQNEDKQLVIHGKLPQPGLYAMDIYGKKWAADSKSFPVVATYLIASSSACLDKQPYPQIQKQLAGQTTENIKLKVTPKSQKESILTFDKTTELKIDFDTPVEVDVTTSLIHHTDGGKQEDQSEYSFKTQTTSTASFSLRFTRTGVYTFSLFGKPKGTNADLPQIYTYVINVSNPNHEWRPFPTTYNKWGAGCDISLTDGHLEEGVEKEVTISAPGAEDVAVITADGQWTHLTKGKGDTFSGKVNTGPAGKMQIFSQTKGEENFGALLEYEVKSKNQAAEEEKKRLKKEKEEKESEEKKRREEAEKQKQREEEFEATKKELMDATASRDSDSLKKAIAKVEKNNYTTRLEKEYNKAKDVKKSINKMTKLRTMILSMDQKTMAIIRSYANPPPLVHATMRAAFLVLGNPLKETKEWKRCQALCNSIELNKRIRAFNVKNVSKDNAKKAKNMLDPIRLEEVEQISYGTKCFYLWTIGMAEEVLNPN